MVFFSFTQPFHLFQYGQGFDRFFTLCCVLIAVNLVRSKGVVLVVRLLLKFGSMPRGLERVNDRFDRFEKRLCGGGRRVVLKFVHFPRKYYSSVCSVQPVVFSRFVFVSCWRNNN